MPKKKIDEPEQIKTEVKKEKTPEFFFGHGRRKTASARVRLHPLTANIEIGGHKLDRGEVFVNNLPMEKYFFGPFPREYISEIYRTTNSANRFITTVIVSGSGKSGQLGAVGLGIAKALVKVDPKFKTTLRKKGYMTRDPRSREREKPGLMGARKEKQSPKR